MIGQQHGQRVRQASRLKWALLFLIVFGSCSLIPSDFAHPGFTSSSIRGTWVFSATGMLPTPGSPPTPFALVGLLTFERNDQCSMTFTINAGGQSWDSFSDEMHVPCEHGWQRYAHGYPRTWAGGLSACGALFRDRE